MKKKIILLLISIVFIGILSYFIYSKINEDKIIDKYQDDIMKLENKISDLEKMNKESKNAFDISFIVGKYTYKKHDESCDIEINLDLKEDGSYTYENSSSCGNNTKAEGTYSLGNNKIYLYNKLCEPVPDSTARKCEYPNCKNVIELDYKDGKIVTNNVMNGKVSAELEKTKE